MTATQTQIRRGTSAQCLAMTPAANEVIADTTNKRLRYGDGSRAGGWEVPNFADIQKNAFNYASAGGTGDAITLALATAPASYSDVREVNFLATANNTGAVTVNVNSLGTKNLKKMDGGALVALEADDIVSGGVYKIFYDGTQFQVISGIESSAGGAGWTLLAVASGGGSTYDFTGDFTSDYEVYAFVINGLTFSSNAADLCMRIRRSGQGSFDSGSSDYGSGCDTFSYSANVGWTALASSSSMKLIDNSNNASGSVIDGIVYGFGLGQARRASFQAELQCVNATGAYSSRSVGQRYSTTAIDGVRFLMNAGTFSGGDILLFGLRNAL